MAPTTPDPATTAAALAAAARASLAALLPDNAVFLAQRAADEWPSEEHYLLLATAHYRADAPHRAKRLLMDVRATSDEARYLLALACLATGDPAGAEAALLPGGGVEDGGAHPTPPSVPGGAAGFLVLARAARASGRPAAAAAHAAAALALDPLLWAAHAELLAVGAVDEADALMGGGGGGPALPAPRLPGDGGEEGAGAHHHPGRPGAVALLRALAVPAAALARLDTPSALAALASLPRPHRESAWALALAGRAMAEAVDYPGAAAAFSAAAAADPAGLEGVAHHSTVLWHLRRRADAAALASAALATDRRSPGAWVAAGNALSLAGEPGRALAAFRRAVALDPAAPYAHTLAGHEHAAAGDADAAIACFRAALRLDARHYNAWYGIGQVYFRQEKWELAEYHFRRARALHPRSSVLATCLGAALARSGPGRAAEAEAALADAVAADPRNPLARFERAALLASAGRTEAALAELEALKRVAPREAGVWFQAGRLHARAGRAAEARSHLAAALDLAPAAADAALIKAALDRLGRGGAGGGWESEGESEGEL